MGATGVRAENPVSLCSLDQCDMGSHSAGEQRGLVPLPYREHEAGSQACDGTMLTVDTGQMFVPATPSDACGALGTPIAGNIIPAARINPMAKTRARYFPMRADYTDPTWYTTLNNRDEWQLVRCFDYNPSDKHRVSFCLSTPWRTYPLTALLITTTSQPRANGRWQARAGRNAPGSELRTTERAAVQRGDFGSAGQGISSNAHFGATSAETAPFHLQSTTFGAANPEGKADTPNLVAGTSPQ